MRRKGVIEDEVFAEVETLANDYPGVRHMLEFVRSAARGIVS